MRSFLMCRLFSNKLNYVLTFRAHVLINYIIIYLNYARVQRTIYTDKGANVDIIFCVSWWKCWNTKTNPYSTVLNKPSVSIFTIYTIVFNYFFHTDKSSAFEFLFLTIILSVKKVKYTIRKYWFIFETYVLQRRK